jgi:glutamate dehydrogenase
MRDDLYAVMIGLTATVAQQTASGDTDARIEAWLEESGPSTRRAVDEAMAAAQAQDGSGMATLSVAVRRLRSLVR